MAPLFHRAAIIRRFANYKTRQDKKKNKLEEKFL